MAENLDFLLTCCVCREKYREDGNRTPRTLPCKHTTCGFCIKNIIKNNIPGQIVCPLCRETHEAEDQERSFPLNTDILIEVQRQKVCEKHGKKLDYYCFEGERRIPVCTECLETDHKGHDFKEIKQFNEQKKKEMLEYVANMEKNAIEFKERILSVSEEIIHKLNDWIYTAVEFPVNEELSAVDSTLKLLNHTRETVHDGIYDERDLETLRKMKTNMCGRREFHFPVPNGSLNSLDIELYPIILPDWEDRINSQLLPRLTEKSTIDIQECVLSFTLLKEDKALVRLDTSTQDEDSFLSSYDLKTGRRLLEGFGISSSGFAAVKLGQKSALALSNCPFKEICFRDADNLDRILYTHSVAPHDPYLMCSATPSKLLYVDSPTSEVHWLDLSESQPKPAAGKSVIHLGPDFISDMCFVQNGDKSLLVVAADGDGISAYNTETGNPEYRVMGKLRGMKEVMLAEGIATDGRGNLFVADTANWCIQMFSASDSYYIGCLMKTVETFGCPHNIRWCENTSSLICECKFEDEKCCLKVLDVKYPSSTNS